MANVPEVDYVQSHRALAVPRYAVRFYFLKLTWGEGLLAMIAGCLTFGAVNLLGINAYRLFYLEIDPFLWLSIMFLLVALFCTLHKFRPDLGSWELLSSLLSPKQFSDRGDRSWKPRNAHYRKSKKLKGT